MRVCSMSVKTSSLRAEVDEGGQIKVGAGTMLDHEASKTSYMVTVKAEDSYGAATTIMT